MEDCISVPSHVTNRTSMLIHDRGRDNDTVRKNIRREKTQRDSQKINYLIHIRTSSARKLNGIQKARV